MIVGLGTDIVNIGRIEKTLERFGSRFVNKFFSEKEQQDFDAIKVSDRLRACKAAKYFAAKEAAAKALGTGFSNGIEWREIAISHDENGTPLLDLSGKALTRVLQLCDGGRFQSLVSLSDDYPFAQAVVIIEKI